MIQKNPGGDPSLFPVLDALNATGQLEAENPGYGGWSAHCLNQLPVIRRVNGFGFHCPIKHHVYSKVNMLCINNTFSPATIARMKEMNERMQRLYEAAREAGHLTGESDQATLARLLNVAPQNVSNWESRGPSGEAVLSAQEILGISATWVLKGLPPKFVGTPPQRPAHGVEMDSDERPDLVSVRKVIFKISGGIAGFSVDYLDNGEGVPLFFSRAWVEKRGYDPKKLYAAKVSGQSMEPTLFNADLIVVNTGDTEKEDGVVYAVNYEGEFTVKRLIRDMREWWLVSDNPDQKRFPRKMCHEGTYLLGRVVHRQGEHL